MAKHLLQAGEPITITSKNIGPIMRRAMKMFKKMDKFKYEVITPEQYYKILQEQQKTSPTPILVSEQEYKRLIKRGIIQV